MLWIVVGPVDLRAQLQNPVPAITAALVPTSAPPGIYSVAVHITGTGFISASVVNWNGTPIMTQSVSSTQLIALVPQADLVAAGSASISVTNPPPAGGTSNSVTFNIAVSPFAPTLSNL
ncbi:MAG: IPT/TIG domain-containing protein, partial [Candidatus Acidiferrales bacterium]